MDNAKFKILTVTLNPALDKVCHVSKISLGKKRVFVAEEISAGGKGINVSRGLKNIGIPQTAITMLGGVNGVLIGKLLRKERVSVKHVNIKGNTRVNTTIIDQRGRIKRVLEKGPMVDLREWAVFYDAFLKQLSACSHVVFSGRLCRSAQKSMYKTLIEAAKANKRFVILDTSGPGLREGLLGKPDLLKINLKEAEEVLRKQLKTQKQIMSALKSFYEKGVGQVIISCGRQGAYGFDGQSFWKARPPRVTRKHGVGCGDAMIAGYIYAEKQKEEFAGKLAMAVAAGTASCYSKVPGNFKKDDLRKIKGRVTLKRIA